MWGHQNIKSIEKMCLDEIAYASNNVSSTSIQQNAMNPIKIPEIIPRSGNLAESMNL